MKPWMTPTALAAMLLADAAPAVAAPAHPVDAMALYNHGAAVVEDSRQVRLVAGRQQIAWPVAGGLDAQTFWLAGNGVRLAGFRLDAAAAAPKNPLAARIGRPVRLTRGGRSKKGRLVALAGDIAFVRIGARIERIAANAPWQLSWPADGGRQHNAGLTLELAAQAPGPRKLTATYQIAAPGWQASYTGRFDPDAQALALQSTAVIDNSQGQTALDARKAWLVAGEVARAGGNGPRPLRKTRAQPAGAGAGAPRASGETYRYALHGPLHVPAGAVRAVALMGPVAFNAQRHYCFANYALSDSQQRQHASVAIRFKNTGDAPLPAGTVRIYNAGGSADLMGAAPIGDTPAGAPVDLTLGQSFDLTATHRVEHAPHPPKKNTRKRRVEITVYNAGKRATTVSLVEHLPRGATVVFASHKRDRQASTGDTAMWRLSVPARGQSTLGYTVAWPAR